MSNHYVSFRFLSLLLPGQSQRVKKEEGELEHKILKHHLICEHFCLNY